MALTQTHLTAHTITALLTVRDKVIALSSPGSGHHGEAANQRSPNIDRDYETLRLALQTLFNDLGISTKTAAA